MVVCEMHGHPDNVLLVAVLKVYCPLFRYRYASINSNLTSVWVGHERTSKNRLESLRSALIWNAFVTCRGRL